MNVHSSGPSVTDQNILIHEEKVGCGKDEVRVSILSLSTLGSPSLMLGISWENYTELF